MQKEILVLAKSWKQGGFCVAGLEVRTRADGSKSLTRNWIRPVCASANSEYTGALPKVWCDSFGILDCIDLKLDRHVPAETQPENWLLRSAPVKGVYSLSDVLLLGNIAANDALWTDAETLRDDQIGAAAVTGIAKRSLVLIQPRELKFRLLLRETQTGVKRKILVSFMHNGHRYRDISITDPAIGKIYSRQFPQRPGETVVTTLNHGDNYFLTLSLSPRFIDGYHYMVGATVIDHTGYLNRNYA